MIIGRHKVLSSQNLSTHMLHRSIESYSFKQLPELPVGKILKSIEIEATGLLHSQTLASEAAALQKDVNKALTPEFKTRFTQLKFQYAKEKLAQLVDEFTVTVEYVNSDKIPSANLDIYLKSAFELFERIDRLEFPAKQKRSSEGNDSIDKILAEIKTIYTHITRINKRLNEAMKEELSPATTPPQQARIKSAEFTGELESKLKLLRERRESVQTRGSVSVTALPTNEKHQQAKEKMKTLKVKQTVGGTFLDRYEQKRKQEAEQHVTGEKYLEIKSADFSVATTLLTIISEIKSIKLSKTIGKDISLAKPLDEKVGNKLETLQRLLLNWDENITPQSMKETHQLLLTITAETIKIVSAHFEKLQKHLPGTGAPDIFLRLFSEFARLHGIARRIDVRLPAQEIEKSLPKILGLMVDKVLGEKEVPVKCLMLGSVQQIVEMATGMGVLDKEKSKQFTELLKNYIGKILDDLRKKIVPDTIDLLKNVIRVLSLLASDISKEMMEFVQAFQQNIKTELSKSAKGKALASELYGELVKLGLLKLDTATCGQEFDELVNTLNNSLSDKNRAGEAGRKISEFITNIMASKDLRDIQVIENFVDRLFSLDISKAGKEQAEHHLAVMCDILNSTKCMITPTVVQYAVRIGENFLAGPAPVSKTALNHFGDLLSQISKGRDIYTVKRVSLPGTEGNPPKMVYRMPEETVKLLTVTDKIFTKALNESQRGPADCMPFIIGITRYYREFIQTSERVTLIKRHGITQSTIATFEHCRKLVATDNMSESTKKALYEGIGIPGVTFFDMPWEERTPSALTPDQILESLSKEKYLLPILSGLTPKQWKTILPKMTTEHVDILSKRLTDKKLRELIVFVGKPFIDRLIELKIDPLPDTLRAVVASEEWPNVKSEDIFNQIFAKYKSKLLQNFKELVSLTEEFFVLSNDSTLNIIAGMEELIRKPEFISEVMPRLDSINRSLFTYLPQLFASVREDLGRLSLTESLRKSLELLKVVVLEIEEGRSEELTIQNLEAYSQLVEGIVKHYMAHMPRSIEYLGLAIFLLDYDVVISKKSTHKEAMEALATYSQTDPVIHDFISSYNKSPLMPLYQRCLKFDALLKQFLSTVLVEACIPLKKDTEQKVIEMVIMTKNLLFFTNQSAKKFDRVLPGKDAQLIHYANPDFELK